MRWLSLLVLAACASSKSAEQHADLLAQGKVVERASEEAKASGETHKAAGADFRFAADGPLVAVKDGLSPHGRLLEAHVRGPVDTSWMANASGTQGAEQQTTLQANSASKSASKHSYWPPVTYLLVGLLAAAAGLWLARGKLKLALGVLGRIF